MAESPQSSLHVHLWRGGVEEKKSPIIMAECAVLGRHMEDWDNTSGVADQGVVPV